MVGIVSYLLINFWYNRVQANKSAIKAILFNKVGDIFYILFLMLLIFNYNIIYKFDNIYLYNINNMNILLIGVIVAAVAKSAQIGLHNWLGDAMEGPTPVSALLHAATMVTAGIFLLYRIIPINLCYYNIYNIMSYIGVLTIILGGLISIFQNDIKKIIAYSTCSQLGYMFYVNSLGLINNSYYHLIIHGFFKALLFLSAGILIHSYNNNQDLRKYGGIIYFSPYLYITFLIGVLSLISWPFFSGFYSKDLILIQSYLSNYFTYIIVNIGVILTNLYSIRMIYLIFYNKPKKKYIYHKEPKFINFYILFIGSLFIGFIIKYIFTIGNTTLNFYLLPFFSTDFEFLPIYISLIPIFIMLICIILGVFIDKLIYIINFKYFINYIIYFYYFINKKFFFDYIYNNYITYPILLLSYSQILKFLDKGIFDILGSLGFFRTFSLYTYVHKNNTLSKESTYLNYYYFYFLLFIFLIFLLLSFI